jgi:protein-tyrosine phosphatase
MRSILESQLWIGNAQDARNFTKLFELGIDAVIDVAMEELPEPPPRELMWLRIPLSDGAGNAPARLRMAINAVVKMISGEIPTLVACSGGMSRSPAIVAAALAEIKNEPADDWLVRVVAGAPHDVAPLFWRDVKQLIRSK